MRFFKYLLIVLAGLSSSVATFGATNASAMDEKQTELQLCDMPTPPFWLLVSPGELAEFSKSLEVCEDLKLMGTVGPEDLIATGTDPLLGIWLF